MRQKLNITVVLGVFPVISETFIVNHILDLLNKGHQVNILSYKKGNFDKIHQNILDNHLLGLTSFYHKPPHNFYQRFYKLLKLWLQNLFIINYDVLWKLIITHINKSEFYNLSLFYKAQWYLDSRKRCDLIHVHFGTNVKKISHFKNKKIINCPVIVTFHGYDLKPDEIEKNRKRYGNLFRFCDSFIVNSQYLHAILKATKPELEDFKIHIIPVGLDVSMITVNALKSEVSATFRIIFCGRLINFKGPHLMIEILNELVHHRGHSNVQLNMIGSGPLYNSINNLIKEYRLDNKVVLMGSLLQNEVFKTMAEADVFVLPGIEDEQSRAETQGLVVQEAQFMGLPVIVSDAGGTKYGMVNGKSGIVVPQKDVMGFADAIETLKMQPNLIKSMGHFGRQFVIDNYNITELGYKLENIYRELLEKDNA